MTMEVIDTGVDTIRTGLLGGGFMGRVHTQAARATGARLEAVATSNLESAQAAARTLGYALAVTEVPELVRAGVDVVHVCTPNATHADFARAAIDAGVHVICEKPLATSAQEASELVAQAASKGLIAAVPFVYRYHPTVREMRARVQDGSVGTLLTLDGGYLQDWMLDASDDDWRAHTEAGGPSRAFADIGSHLCDLAEFVTGERIVSLTARTRRFFAERSGVPVDTEDIAAVMVEFASGALGTLLVTQMAPGRKNALLLELHGTKTSLGFAQERPEELWIGSRVGSHLLLRDPETFSSASARIQTLPAGHPLGYQDAFTAFVADVYAAIRTGEIPDGMPEFSDGARAAVLTEAVLASAASRQWIEVPS